MSMPTGVAVFGSAIAGLAIFLAYLYDRKNKDKYYEKFYGHDLMHFTSLGEPDDPFLSRGRNTERLERLNQAIIQNREKHKNK
jgi:hypothetical protein